MTKEVQKCLRAILFAIYLVWGFMLLSPAIGVAYNLLGCIVLVFSIFGLYVTVSE